MYAVNYTDSADMSAIVAFLGEDTVKALDSYMLGWFYEKKVSLIDELYKRMVLTFASRHHLS